MPSTAPYRRLDDAVRRAFDLDRPLGRPAYVLTLMSVISVHFYGVNAILRSMEVAPWSFSQYIAPLMDFRSEAFNARGVLGFLALWTLPFLAAAAVASIRRARAAGIGGPFLFWLIVPVVQFIVAVGLAVAPPVSSDRRLQRAAEPPERFAGAAQAIVVGAAAGGLVFGVAFAVLNSPYGLALFVGVPMVIGLVTTVAYNRVSRKGGASSQIVSQLALVAGAGTLLLIGVEGGLCLAMVLPLAMPLVAMGSWIGDALVEPGHLETSHLVVLVLASPFLVAFDAAAPSPPTRPITTRVIIDAPPETVWPHVIAFTELPPPNRFYFKLGIAYPIRARIEGTGVGAVRYCEFSTGAFVEPITHWDEPRHLAFDVVEQPPTMHEWSPYDDLHPQHLEDSLVSERGEFRLTPVDGDRTLLEGTTWYRHDLMPQLYWNLWSDTLIHGIHRRVLEHIAAESEADVEA